MVETNLERRKWISFINYEVNNILKEDRRHLLNIIVMEIGTDDLVEEKDGIGILYINISDYLLEDIYEFLMKSLKKTKLKL